MEETSLDRFVSEDTGGRPADGDAVEEGEDDTVAADREWPAATLSYEPEGAPCGDCGRAVSRRWHTDAGPRCDRCRNW